MWPFLVSPFYLLPRSGKHQALINVDIRRILYPPKIIIYLLDPKMSSFWGRLLWGNELSFCRFGSLRSSWHRYCSFQHLLKTAKSAQMNIQEQTLPSIHSWDACHWARVLTYAQILKQSWLQVQKLDITCFAPENRYTKLPWFIMISHYFPTWTRDQVG